MPAAENLFASEWHMQFLKKTIAMRWDRRWEYGIECDVCDACRMCVHTKAEWSIFPHYSIGLRTLSLIEKWATRIIEIDPKTFRLFYVSELMFCEIMLFLNEMGFCVFKMDLVVTVINHGDFLRHVQKTLC